MTPQETAADGIGGLIVLAGLLYALWLAVTNPRYRRIVADFALDLLDNRNRKARYYAAEPEPEPEPEPEAEPEREPTLPLPEHVDTRVLLLAAHLLARKGGKPLTATGIAEAWFGLRRGGANRRYEEVKKAIEDYAEAIRRGVDPIIRHEGKTPVRLDLRTGEEYVIDPATRGRVPVVKSAENVS